MSKRLVHPPSSTVPADVAPALDLGRLLDGRITRDASTEAFSLRSYEPRLGVDHPGPSDQMADSTGRSRKERTDMNTSIYQKDGYYWIKNIQTGFCEIVKVQLGCVSFFDCDHHYHFKDLPHYEFTSFVSEFPGRRL